MSSLRQFVLVWFVGFCLALGVCWAAISQADPADADAESTESVEESDTEKSEAAQPVESTESSDPEPPDVVEGETSAETEPKSTDEDVSPADEESAEGEETDSVETKNPDDERKLDIAGNDTNGEKEGEELTISPTGFLAICYGICGGLVVIMWLILRVPTPSAARGSEE